MPDTIYEAMAKAVANAVQNKVDQLKKLGAQPNDVAHATFDHLTEARLRPTMNIHHHDVPNDETLQHQQRFEPGKVQNYKDQSAKYASLTKAYDAYLHASDGQKFPFDAPGHSNDTKIVGKVKKELSNLPLDAQVAIYKEFRAQTIGPAEATAKHSMPTTTVPAVAQASDLVQR